MTIQIFAILFVILAAVAMALTEAIKVASKEKFSNNLIALIVSIVIGGGGSVFAYIWLGIAFTLPSILAIIAMVLAVWMGAQLGYDKIKQLIEQIAGK